MTRRKIRENILSRDWSWHALWPAYAASLVLVIATGGSIAVALLCHWHLSLVEGFLMAIVSQRSSQVVLRWGIWRQGSTKKKVEQL